MFNSRKAMLQHRPPGCQTADATWKVSREPAQENAFRIGDSALRMDPSSGRGVMRAMMTAIMAVHLIKSVEDGKTDRGTAAKVYAGWITAWFDSDVQELSRILGVSGDVASPFAEATEVRDYGGLRDYGDSAVI